MNENLSREVAALDRWSTSDLVAKYTELFGELTNARNRGFLIKRIAWRMQALAEGGLSERARQRALELANDADLRLSPPRKKKEPEKEAESATVVEGTLPPSGWDNRIPLPPTILTRTYKGRLVQVHVRHNGFEFEGQIYSSLSAVAGAITGSHCNGFLFFKLEKRGNK